MSISIFTKILNILRETNSYGNILIKINNHKYIGCFGYKKINIKNNEEIKFRIFSLSKPIIALLVIILAEKGILNLNETINIGKLKKIKNSEKIKIIDLLNHRSGLFDSVSSFFGNKKPEYLYDKLTKNKLKQTIPLAIDNIIINILDNVNPGDYGKFRYNNTGYDLLGYIIKLKTNKKISVLLKEYIFSKLNMKNTCLMSEDNDCAYPFKTKLSYGILEQQGEINCNANIISTINDYFIFINSYYNLLSSKFIKIYENLYFFKKINKSLLMMHTGGGDFPNKKKNYHPLSRSLLIKYNNIQLIIFQNYSGSNPLIFDNFSANKTIKDYDMKKNFNISNTILYNILKLLSLNIKVINWVSNE